MDQKFISGNFLPPPRGYPPIAPLNNGLSSDFFYRSLSLKRPLIGILLPFPGLNLVSSRARGGMERWEGEHLVPSSILPRRLIRGRIDRPALPPHRFTSNTPFSAIPHPPKYSPQFPFLPSTHSLVLAKGDPHPTLPPDPFLENLAPSSWAAIGSVLLSSETGAAAKHTFSPPIAQFSLHPQCNGFLTAFSLALLMNQQLSLA